MLLHKESASQGNWLFRWRSYIPLVVIPLMIPPLLEYSYPHESHTCDQLWEIACLSLSLLGLAIRAITVGFVPGGTSGRNTRSQIADSLNTTGIYSVMRNPLYVGNFFMMLGVVMFLQSFWLGLTFSVLFWFYYERIILAEEAFLLAKFGEEYERYADRTPALIPRFRGWIRPELPFSLRTVLRREYSSLFALITCFFTVEVLTDLVNSGRFEFDVFWLIVFALAALTYLTLRTLKKRTTLLNVEGRY